MLPACRLAGLSALKWTMPLDARPLKGTEPPEDSNRLI
jgi:hypothetical protein